LAGRRRDLRGSAGDVGPDEIGSWHGRACRATLVGRRPLLHVVAADEHLVVLLGSEAGIDEEEVVVPAGLEEAEGAPSAWGLRILEAVGDLLVLGVGRVDVVGAVVGGQRAALPAALPRHADIGRGLVRAGGELAVQLHARAVAVGADPRPFRAEVATGKA